VTGHRDDYNATVSETVMFAGFYVCWFECAVCSEVGDENTIEDCMLSQCDTEHCRTLQLSQCDTEHYKRLHAVTM